jgi:antitoxin MazE
MLGISLEENAMSKILVGKWGKNLAIRFPGEIAEAAGLKEGERVDLTLENGQIVIRKAAPHFDLEEAFKGKTPEEWREFYKDAYDWGPDVGREIVDDD